jgi:hypothetical protein
MSYEVGKALEADSLFLHDLIEKKLIRTKDDWHPDDYAMSSSESRAAIMTSIRHLLRGTPDANAQLPKPGAHFRLGELLRRAWDEKTGESQDLARAGASIEATRPSFLFANSWIALLESSVRSRSP